MEENTSNKINPSQTDPDIPNGGNKDTNILSSDLEKLIAKPPATATKKERLLCLDVLRGLTMAGMIMVNAMGDW